MQVNGLEDGKVTITGTIDGRVVKYEGEVARLAVDVKPGWEEINSWFSYSDSIPMRDDHTYTITLKLVDGVAMTATVEPKKIIRTARVHFGGKGSTGERVKAARKEVGAGPRATHAFVGNEIEFRWVDEV